MEESSDMAKQKLGVSSMWRHAEQLRATAGRAVRHCAIALVPLWLVACGDSGAKSSGGAGGNAGVGQGAGSKLAGSSTSGDTAEATAGTGAAAGCQKGRVTANEVVLIGDSAIQIPGTLPIHLRDLARAAGALGADETYPNRAVSGTPMKGIAAQYTAAEKETPEPKVLIMNGGGVDIVLDSSETSITAAVATATDLYAQIAMDGTVQQIIFFYYANIPAYVEPLNIQRPLMQAVCQASSVPCHFLDLRPVFDGNDFFGPDNVHPNSAGGEAIADAIWNIMKENCIAQ